MAKKDPRGYYRQTITIGGKKHDIRAKTKQELNDKVVSLQVEYKTNSMILDKTISVERWVELWMINYKKEHVSAAQYLNLKYIIDKHIIPNIGKMAMCDVKAIHLQAIMNKVAKYSSSHIKHIYFVLNEMLEQAEVNELILKNPARRLTIPEGSYAGHRALTQTERKHILNVADTHYAGMWIKMMLYCGLRPAEACALLWSDIDLDKGTVSINKALEGGSGGNIKQPKTKAGIRVIPIPDVYKNELIVYKTTAKSDYIFLTATGLPIDRAGMSRLWRYFARQVEVEMGSEFNNRGKLIKSKMPGVSLYSLRHTYATDLQTAGVPLNIAKYLLGHSDISVTANIYTHSSDESIESARLMLNKFLS